MKDDTTQDPHVSRRNFLAGSGAVLTGAVGAMAVGGEAMTCWSCSGWDEKTQMQLRVPQVQLNPLGVGQPHANMVYGPSGMTAILAVGWALT